LDSQQQRQLLASSLSSCSSAQPEKGLVTQQLLQLGTEGRYRMLDAAAAAAADAWPMLQSCLSSNNDVTAAAGWPQLLPASSSFPQELQQVLQEQHSCALDSRVAAAATAAGSTKTVSQPLAQTGSCSLLQQMSLPAAGVASVTGLNDASSMAAAPPQLAGQLNRQLAGTCTASAELTALGMSEASAVPAGTTGAPASTAAGHRSSSMLVCPVDVMQIFSPAVSAGLEGLVDLLPLWSMPSGGLDELRQVG
jgi:hypothetical protein